MKIRLHGTEDECREMTELLESIMVVQAVSDPYPDRGRSVLVRVYVEGTPHQAPGATQSWRGKRVSDMTGAEVRAMAGAEAPARRRQDQRASALAQRMSRKSGGAQ